MELRVCKTFLEKPCYRGDSLRSKSFQSTHCARVGAIAKKWKMGEGRGEDENPLPSPPTELLFLTPVPTFSKNASVKACYAGYSDYTAFLVNEKRRR